MQITKLDFQKYASFLLLSNFEPNYVFEIVCDDYGIDLSNDMEFVAVEYWFEEIIEYININNY
jgi:hypothetical protein